MIVAVPAETPVTTPDELTVATAVLELDHVPPPPVVEKVEVEPIQTVCVPESVPALLQLVVVKVAPPGKIL